MAARSAASPLYHSQRSGLDYSIDPTRVRGERSRVDCGRAKRWLGPRQLILYNLIGLALYTL